MKWKKYFICSLALLPVFFSLIFSQSANAESLSVSSFGLFGQKTYGSANSWQNNLTYAGTDMHSVFKWEVWSRSLSAQETGKYASIGLSGLINIPPDFTVATSQGFTIEQCVVGNTSASLSQINTGWAVNNATATSPPQIIWSATALLEFPTNDISGQMYCTLRSNGGLYFLLHSTTGVGTVSFGTTNFNVTFNNNLSDELLQQQINQNNTMINQNNQIISELQDQSNQQQQQYDQEKQEEAEREESGNDSADEMSGIFNFTIPNPFVPILSMFTDGGSCVNIPTIAGMVGSNDTQFCPWFPSSVRNVLTPVIGLSSSIILFGYIIGWLAGATRGSIEQVEEVSK